jgi:hypothetical protein
MGTTKSVLEYTDLFPSNYLNGVLVRQRTTLVPKSWPSPHNSM